MSVQNENNVVLNENSVEGKPCINRTNLSYKSVILWNNGKYILDVYLGLNENVATFYLYPGYNKFQMLYPG